MGDCTNIFGWGAYSKEHRAYNTGIHRKSYNVPRAFKRFYTVALVEIDSVPVASMYRFLELLVLAYAAYFIIMEKQYMKPAPAFGDTNFYLTTLNTSITDPPQPYCSNSSAYSWAWGLTWTFSYPENACVEMLYGEVLSKNARGTAHVATHYTKQKYTIDADGKRHSSPPVQSFVSGVDTATINLEHSASYLDQHTLTLSVVPLPKTVVLDFHGDEVRTFEAGEVLIFPLTELLQLAGIGSLDDFAINTLTKSLYDEDDLPYGSIYPRFRDTGIVLYFVMEYSNYDHIWDHDVTAKISVRYVDGWGPIQYPPRTIIDNNQFHYEETTAYGIHMTTLNTGEVGTFDFQTLLFTIVNYLVLLKIAETLTEAALRSGMCGEISREFKEASVVAHAFKNKASHRQKFKAALICQKYFRGNRDRKKCEKLQKALGRKPAGTTAGIHKYLKNHKEQERDIGIPIQPSGGDYQPSGGDYQPSGGDYQPSGGDRQPSGGDRQPSGGDYAKLTDTTGKSRQHRTGMRPQISVSEDIEMSKERQPTHKLGIYGI